MNPTTTTTPTTTPTTTTFELVPVDDDARFVIAPFEHRGASFDPRPLLAVRFARFEATFELKLCREWLFFRARERPDAVFAIATLPTGLSSPHEHAQWLELALESEQFHRFVALDDAHSTLQGPFLFFFASDGRGFVREPWDADGPKFEWNSAGLSTPAFLLLPGDLFFEQIAELMRGDYRSPSSSLWCQLVERDIESDARFEAPLEWLCGSQDDLAGLTRALLHTQPNFWGATTRAQVEFSSESQYGRAALLWIGYDGSGRASNPAHDERIRLLSDLFLDFNTPVGHRWEFQDALGGRASWEPTGQAIKVEVAVPSAHERLEAALFLRDWLGDKLPADEIEALLR